RAARPRGAARARASHERSSPEAPAHFVQVPAVGMLLQARAQELERLLAIAERPVDVDEMRGDLGIGLEPIRALEIAERLLVLAEPEQHPPHAVDDRRVVGIHRERLLDVAARLAMPVELIGQQIAERVQERRVVRMLLDERFENADRPAVLALLLIEKRQRVAQRAVARVAAEPFLEQPLRLLELAAL